MRLWAMMIPMIIGLYFISRLINPSDPRRSGEAFSAPTSVQKSIDCTELDVRANGMPIKRDSDKKIVRVDVCGAAETDSYILQFTK